MMLKKQRLLTGFALAAAGISCYSTTANAQVVISGSGANTTTALNDYRSAIGGVNNGVAPPPAVGGRREINWDAVQLTAADFGGNVTVIDNNNTVNIAVNRFQTRGVRFSTNTAVSGDDFVSTSSAGAGQLNDFSPTRTFAPFNSNMLTTSFVFASAANTTPEPAGTFGFGAIFVDVELANTSSIEYFNGNTSLGTFFVPTAGSGEHSFLGVLFDQPIVTSVKLTVGTNTLFTFNGTSFTAGVGENLGGNIDLAGLDDFIYAEPTRAVPEPSAVALFASMTLAGGWMWKRRKASRN